jgi:hypothetical protein
MECSCSDALWACRSSIQASLWFAKLVSFSFCRSGYPLSFNWCSLGTSVVFFFWIFSFLFLVSRFSYPVSPRALYPLSLFFLFSALPQPVLKWRAILCTAPYLLLPPFALVPRRSLVDPDPVGSETCSRIQIRKKSFRIRAAPMKWIWNKVNLKNW